MQENLDQAKYLSARKFVDYYSFLAPTGYTQAAIDNIKSMESVGVSISLKCMHGKMVGTGFSSNERNWLVNLLNKKSHPLACQFLHAIPPRWNSVPKNKNRIALFVFENNKILPSWIAKLKECMAVIVPSKFNYDSLKNYGVDNVFLVNHAVDTSIWNNDIRMPRIDPDKTRIITIGTWRERKNWKNMTLAVCELLKENKDIEWTLKVDKGNIANEDLKKWLTEANCINFLNSKIKLDSRILDESAMARLVSSHDILLSASLGEGFGLPALQSCFSGLVVVCPRYGGYNEFFDEDSYFEIKPKGVIKIPKMDNLLQFDDLEWPLYDKDSIMDALYLCIGNLQKAKSRVSMVAERASKKFNHKTIGMSFLNVLNTCDAIPSNKNT